MSRSRWFGKVHVVDFCGLGRYMQISMVSDINRKYHRLTMQLKLTVLCDIDMYCMVIKDFKFKIVF